MAIEGFVPPKTPPPSTRRRSVSDTEGPPSEETRIAPSVAKPRPSRAPSKRERSRSRKSGKEGHGTRIGRYTVIDRIGLGSIAEVLLARYEGAQGFEKKVVLKRLLPELASDEACVDIFVREAKNASQIVHPNVVQILDLVFSGQQPTVAMEQVSGWTLGQVIARCKKQGTQIPIGLVCRIMSDAAAGLAAAHDLLDAAKRPTPILHRNVTPQNIMISTGGAVKIGDFALSLAADVGTLTGTDGMRGRPAYMAPERLAGDKGGVDGRADIFSLGAVMCEAVVLQAIFQRATTFETMLAVMRDPLTPLNTMRSDIPRPLEAIVERACQKTPEDRFPTAYAMQLEIERCLQRLGDPPVTAHHLETWLKTVFPQMGGEEDPQEEHVTDATMSLSDHERKLLSRELERPKPGSA
jgi:serine/threonine-protein kinase